MNPKVDWFFNGPSKWQDAYYELRTLVLDCGLTEELKWGCPCYTNGKSNILLIHVLKIIVHYFSCKERYFKTQQVS